MLINDAEKIVRELVEDGTLFIFDPQSGESFEGRQIDVAINGACVQLSVRSDLHNNVHGEYSNVHGEYSHAAMFGVDRNDWIRIHGSARLRRMVEEGIECEATYWDERIARECPGWILATSPKYYSPRNVSNADFDLLDGARQNKNVVNARLACVLPDDGKSHCYTGPLHVVIGEYGPKTLVFLTEG